MVTYEVEADVCLFDLDGTLVSTTLAAEAVWRSLCKKHNVDPEELFKVSHGSRTEEVMAIFFPQLDNTNNRAVDALERSIADDYADTVTVIPGAKELLMALNKGTDGENTVDFKDGNHKRKWAIVTSATPYMPDFWFKSILKDVGRPDVVISGADVTRGKPDPQGFLLARDRLANAWGYNPVNSCKAIVFEDAPVGIEAGKRMGAITIGLTSSYSKERMFASGADYVVEDLRNVSVVKNPEHGKLVLRITDPLSRE